MMTAFGYYPYSEPGVGNGIILAWGIFFNTVAWIVLLLEQSATRIYISENQDDLSSLTRVISSLSFRKVSSKSINSINPSPDLTLSGGAGPGPVEEEHPKRSNIKSLPRMIQQKPSTNQFQSTNDLQSRSSGSLALSLSGCDSDNNSMSSKIKSAGSRSPQYQTVEADEEEEQATQLHRVQSMLTPRQETQIEASEIAIAIEDPSIAI
jgi:hypothetical protein